MAAIWDDQRDLLLELNARGVEYVVVGGHAVGEHSEPRATKDLDLLIRDSLENSEALFQALAAWGAPLAGMSPADFRDPNGIFQLGVPPSRIDILQTLTGLDTEEVWKRRVSGTLGDVDIPVQFISAADLLKNKVETGRLQDLADAEKLQRALQAEEALRRKHQEE